MRGMTKKELIIELRQQGVPRVLIPEKAGCSLNYARAILRQSRQDKFRSYSKQQCIYNGVREWLNTSKIHPYELAEMILGDGSEASITCITRRLSGKTKMDIDTALDLMKLSGKTFEELFVAGGNA